VEVKVRFRFNKKSGEVEMFEVDHEGPKNLSEEEHNREHERIAAELGNVLERNPRVTEILPGSIVIVNKDDLGKKDEGTPDTPEKEKKRNKGR
jgi:hypothetical protein